MVFLRRQFVLLFHLFWQTRFSFSWSTSSLVGVAYSRIPSRPPYPRRLPSSLVRLVRPTQKNSSENSFLLSERRKSSGDPECYEEQSVKPATEKRSSSKRKAKLVEEPTHWTNTSDPLLIIKGGHSYDMLRFTVRGNPLPLRRHRTSRGFMYNPSAKAQESFRNCVTALIFNATQDGSLVDPIFPTEPLHITLLFRLRRPLNHFRSSKPGQGRLRETAPDRLAVTRMDVDNLAKFVLDSMNGILYEDDKQIASLHLAKLFDNEGACRGATELMVRPFLHTDLHSLDLPPTKTPGLKD